MASISWGTIKSLLIFLGPVLLPKIISYYRQFRASSRATNPKIQGLSPPALRAILILAFASLVLFIRALPPFAPENVFTRTSSRLQIPTDVLFTRIASLRPDGVLTETDAALRVKFVNLESRLLYLQYGPDVLASCPFCSSEEPRTYLFYALPSLLAPHLLNVIILSLATSATITGPEAARWRSIAVGATAVLAGVELWSISTYNHSANAQARRFTDIDAFFWAARAQRCVKLGVLDAGIAALIWLSATNRLFASQPSTAARVEAVTRQLLATKSKLSGVGIVKNTNLRDEDLRARTAAYWTQEGRVMREVMEEREVVEGINDALANRINIQDISRDAENYALNMLPQPMSAVPASTPPGKRD
ncbi:hypothetical protein GGR55DRAFT_206725 [Xylaria sp. FL0064]|nr:hypothetical protein GGR55DRAFT_206725 [Xylaria sp. FL0064]